NLVHSLGRMPIEILLLSDPFPGSSDEISIWSRGLTANKVTELTK
ncbi:MAG: hypothetical protein ACI91J_002840, partial [Yoonia sp.]